MKRWKLQLDEFNLILEHYRNERKNAADVLSRLFTKRVVRKKQLLDGNKIKGTQDKTKLDNNASENVHNEIVENETLLFDNKDRLFIP